MIDFLIKSTISLCILLIAYHLFLQKEKMFVFNRYFLLVSLVFSLAVPFLSFEVQGEIPIVYENTIPLATISTDTFPIQTKEIRNFVIEEHTNYGLVLLWSIYIAITLILSFRFIRNIYRITHKAKGSKVIVHQNTRMVLLSEDNLPYTFWNTIYISQKEFENREIEQELFTHEITHVRQKHTLDVIFVEILKTVFWFSPIFIFYKKAIQLNHEFLADENVLSTHSNVTFYQHLLLNKISAVQPNLLASNLNFLATKKRIIMMKKITSKSKALVIKLAFLVLFTGLIITLCVQFYPSENSLSQELQDKRRDYIYSGIKVIIDNQNENFKLNKLYDNLDINTKRKYLGAYSTPFITKIKPSESEFQKWKNSNEYVIWLNDEKIIDNSNLSYLNRNEIAYFSDHKIDLKFEKASSENNTLYIYTHDYFRLRKLERFPQKYSYKEFKSTVLKAPTKAEMRIIEEKLQKQIEVEKIKRLNTSREYAAQIIDKNKKRINSEIHK